MLEKTLKIGDFVDLESGVRGHVLEIGMRYTRINTNDGVDVIVPNTEFTSRRVVNWTFDDRLRRMRIPFRVAYGTDKNRVREAGLKAAAQVDSTFEDDTHKCDVWLVRMGDSGLEFVLAVWVGPNHIGRPANTEARYMWAIHDALEEAGIAIPFPQQDVHLRVVDADLPRSAAQGMDKDQQD
jgi:small-conductance mechanosensitive channel